MRGMKRIHFMKSGKHTDRKGTALDFSESVLRDIADSYDPALHEAPLVVGHPKTDDPAYGWVKAVELSDDGGYAVPGEVDAAFAEMVGAGRFKKVSCSVYLPDSPSNPKPGHYYLRHIGFLGAQPPSVKGLRPLEYADGEEGVLFFEDYGKITGANLFQRIREFFIEKFGIDAADKVLPSYEIDSIKYDATRDDNRSLSYEEPAKQPPTPTGGDSVKPEDQKAAEFAEREQKLASDATALKAREDAVLARERAIARQESVDFVEGLVHSGKVLPVQKGAYVEALVALEGREAVEFSEGDKKVSKTPREAFMAALLANPKVVDFGEAAKHGKDVAMLPDAPAEAAKELSKRALEFIETEKAAGRTVTLMDAISQVEKEASK
jgi:hypothetical protein